MYSGNREEQGRYRQFCSKWSLSKMLRARLIEEFE